MPSSSPYRLRRPGSRSAADGMKAWQTTASQQATDLPPLVMQRIIMLLESTSDRLELRKVDQRCRQAVDSAWQLACLPLEQLKKQGMEALSARFPSLACLVISAPQQRVSLSILGHRRRCEQLLAVFLDNISAPPPRLAALDISTALASIAASTLQLLVESLPSLQHLALPKVAASSGTHEILHLISQLPKLCSLELDCSLLSATDASINRQQQQQQQPQGNNQPSPPAHDSTATPQYQQVQAMLLQQRCMLLQGLALQPTHTLPLDLLASDQAAPALHCSNSNTAGLLVHRHIAGGSSSSRSSRSSSSPTSAAQASSSNANNSNASSSSSRVASHSIGSDQQQYVQQQPAAPPHVQQHVQQQQQQQQGAQLRQQQQQHGVPPTNPWGQLSSLQQLQLVQPSCLQELLPALAGLKGLGSLGLVRVHKGSSSQLLDPGVGGFAGQGVGQLTGLAGLTRLELGLDQQCSCSSSGAAHTPPKLIIPPHISSDGQLAANSLHLLPTAAAPCISCCWSGLVHLRVLVLSGVCLDSPVLMATAQCSQLSELRVSGLLLDQEVAPEFGGLQELRVLSVTQRWCLGPNVATALFPVLLKLSIKDESSCCPDLSSLKHHSCLSSLSIEAGGPGWQLSGLQLGYLVHISSLKQLGLASRWCGAGQHAVHGGHHHGSSSSSNRGSGSSGALVGSPGSCMHSSHWLPSGSLSQVTCLTLAGPATDHTLSQLPSQFPGMMHLQLLGSYYASDWGLKRLCRAPCLSSLLLEGCEHVTEYGLEVLLRGGSIRVLAVHGCGAVDERACQRIRRACRNGCATQLHWHGSDSSRASSIGGSSSHMGHYFDGHFEGHFEARFEPEDSHHIHPQQQHLHGVCEGASSSSSSAGAGSGASGGTGTGSCCGGCRCSGGSAFLERCWRESVAAAAAAQFTASKGDEQQQHIPGACSQALGPIYSSSNSSNSSKSYFEGSSAAVGAAAAAAAAADVNEHHAALEAGSKLKHQDLEKAHQKSSRDGGDTSVGRVEHGFDTECGFARGQLREKGEEDQALAAAVQLQCSFDSRSETGLIIGSSTGGSCSTTCGSAGSCSTAVAAAAHTQEAAAAATPEAAVRDSDNAGAGEQGAAAAAGAVAGAEGCSSSGAAVAGGALRSSSGSGSGSGSSRGRGSCVSAAADSGTGSLAAAGWLPHHSHPGCHSTATTAAH